MELLKLELYIYFHLFRRMMAIFSPSSRHFHFLPKPHLSFRISQIHFNMHLITPFVAAAVLASHVIAHPGHDIRAEMAERAAFMQTSRHDLSHCAAQMKARGMGKSSVARRAAIAKDGRKKRNIAASKPTYFYNKTSINKCKRCSFSQGSGCRFRSEHHSLVFRELHQCN